MPKQMLSPLTGKLTIYYEHSALMSFQLAAPVPPESLITLMNSDLAANGYDAFVDDAKVIQGSIDTSVQAHIWIAEESPIAAATALAILAICVTACVIGAGLILLASTQTIMEHFWPQPKFYQLDAAGNEIVVHSQAEYITCMRMTHPDAFVCGYCGQVFPTEAERDEHQATCPWKEGVPGAPPDYGPIIIFVAGTVVVLGGIWLIGKLFARR